MQSFLFTGTDPTLIQSQIEKLAKNIQARTIELPFQKIDDAKGVISFVKFRLIEPTAIVLKNVDTATPETLNAFLKNLEEPQENLYYFLTAGSINRVLPTIVSRCQIVKMLNATAKGDGVCQMLNGKAQEFITQNAGQRLSAIDKIKSREEAVEFVTDLIFNLHQLLLDKSILPCHSGPDPESIQIKQSLDSRFRGNDTRTITKLGMGLEMGVKTLNNLKANGNVQLQLTNLVINLN